MSKPLRSDKKTWTFEPDDDVRAMVNLVAERTGWTRTRIINDVLSAFTGSYALEQVQTQKQAIEQLEADIINTVNNTQDIILPDRKKKKMVKKKPNK